MFLQGEVWDCLVIDSVITSRDFTISIDRQRSEDFKLDVPALQDLLAKAQAAVTVSATSQTSLTFKGPKALAFAFSCQQLVLDDEGKILQLPPDMRARAFGQGGPAPHVLISQQPAMLDWAD